MKLTITPVVAALLLALTYGAGSAHAGGGKKEAGPTGAGHLDLASTGLPIIVDGRVKNYVFVQARLMPAPGADLIKLREKEPYYRDALVRAAHRAPLSRAGDWTTVDKSRFEAILLAEARRISGSKSFARAELVAQTPRRRTGMPQPSR
jgi:hypothetical protein